MSPDLGGTQEAGEPRLVFVLGTGRCGSTVVHEVMARHPAVGFVSNVDDRGLEALSRWNGALYRRTPAATSRKGRLRYAPSEGYRLLDRRVSPVLSRPSRDLIASDVSPWLEDRVRRFFLERAQAQHAGTFVHKFTGWPRSGFLHRVFPDCRFVHVVRDGRAVASSWLQMPWWKGWEGPSNWQWGPLPPSYQREWDESGHSFVMLAGIGWKLLMDAFDAARRLVPPSSWLEVHYEDLLADPRGRMGDILQFAGLEWDRGFEAGFGRHSFHRGRSESFRADLGGADLAMLERSLAVHLIRHGYDP